MENKTQEYSFDGKLIIGVDHGFGNMKTRNTVFRTGVKSFKDIPTLGTDVLEYGGMYYLGGEGHKPFAADKVMDQDYYILTLAAERGGYHSCSRTAHHVGVQSERRLQEISFTERRG